MISEPRYPHTHRVSSCHLRQQYSQRWRPIFQTIAEKKKRKEIHEFLQIRVSSTCLTDSKDAVGATPIDDAMIESEYSKVPLQISNVTQQVDTTDVLRDTDSFVTIEELKNVTLSVSTMRSSLYELRKWTIRDLEGCQRGQSSRHVNKSSGKLSESKLRSVFIHLLCARVKLLRQRTRRKRWVRYLLLMKYSSALRQRNFRRKFLKNSQYRHHNTRLHSQKESITEIPDVTQRVDYELKTVNFLYRTRLKIEKSGPQDRRHVSSRRHRRHESPMKRNTCDRLREAPSEFDALGIRTTTTFRDKLESSVNT